MLLCVAPLILFNKKSRESSVIDVGDMINQVDRKTKGSWLISTVSKTLFSYGLKKVGAILFILRCGIPVVIMGETGCGKTCLIRYMCGLQSGPGGPKNMLLMKVKNKTKLCK